MPSGPDRRAFHPQGPSFRRGWRRLAVCLLAGFAAGTAALGPAEGARSPQAAEQPEGARAWLGLAISQHRLSQDDRAVPSLDRAVRLETGLTSAHALLGEILYRRGDTAAAIGHLETATRQDPNDVRVRETLAAARRMRAAEAASDRLYSAHFVLLYQRPADRRAAGRLADRLEALHRRVGRQLAFSPAERVTVILYPARRFHGAADSPVWARGLFDGRIHLPVGEGTTVAEATLAHEYAHALVHRLSGGAAPAWLDEGLALHVEGEDGNVWREVLARHPEEIMSLNTLHGSFGHLPQRSARVAYAESFEATRALLRRYGVARVRQLLQRLAASPEFAPAFEQVFGERYADFDAARLSGWLRAATRNW